MAALPFHILTKLSDLTPYSLQFMADCGSPDSATSPGAVFLSSVLDAVVEAVEDLDVDAWVDLSEAMADERHTIADGAVPIYTHDLWSTFVDLAGYNEDISEYSTGFTGDGDLNPVASVALYVIADRLVDAVVSDIADDLSEAVDAARWQAVIDQARVEGAAGGKGAADWWAQDIFGGRAPGDVAPSAQHILDGIADRDPEVMDSLPSLDLSGQFADGVTTDDILSLVDQDADDLTPEEVADVLDAYRNAYDAAVVEHVEDIARSVVAAAL